MTWVVIGPGTEHQTAEAVVCRCRAAGSCLDDATLRIVATEFLRSSRTRAGDVIEIEATGGVLRLRIVEAERSSDQVPAAASSSSR